MLCTLAIRRQLSSCAVYTPPYLMFHKNHFGPGCLSCHLQLPRAAPPPRHRHSTVLDCTSAMILGQPLMCRTTHAVTRLLLTRLHQDTPKLPSCLCPLWQAKVNSPLASATVRPVFDCVVLVAATIPFSTARCLLHLPRSRFRSSLRAPIPPKTSLRIPSPKIQPCR